MKQLMKRIEETEKEKRRLWNFYYTLCHNIRYLSNDCPLCGGKIIDFKLKEKVKKGIIFKKEVIVDSSSTFHACLKCGLITEDYDKLCDSFSPLESGKVWERFSRIRQNSQLYPLNFKLTPHWFKELGDLKPKIYAKINEEKKR